jgi:hypothetical protein
MTIATPRASQNGSADDLTVHANTATGLADLATRAALDDPPDTNAAGSAAAAATAHAAAATAKAAATKSRTLNQAKTTGTRLSVGTAIAVTFWTIATATVWKHTFSSGKLTLLIASTAVIVTAVIHVLSSRLNNGKQGNGA